MSVNSAAKETRPSRLFFLKQYLRKPFGIGAVAPSSHKLARLMVENIDLQPSDVVVELGPGTGVFTRELIAQGVAPANLILVETNLQFVMFLKKEFPGVRVVAGDARELPRILKSLGLGHVEKIVSGIPMRTIKPVDRKLIAKAIAASLKSGGVLVQFSYFTAPPFPKSVVAEAGLVGHRVGVAMGNMPPAFVWRYGKAG